MINRLTTPPAKNTPIMAKGFERPPYYCSMSLMLKITWCQRVELFLGFLQSHFPNKAWFLFGDLKEKKKNILLDIVGLDEKEQERNFSLKLAARRTLRKGELEEEKTPDPNGFTIGFYQECWETIKDDLLRVFLEFHNNRIINRSTNVTFIALVPKKSQSSRISYYRPISLVTNLYKIIAKILDVVLIANELVDEKRRSRKEGLVFKIDFEKAYDHVDWDFLDHVLERKGFSLRWRSWMRGCLSSVTFAILVNGNAKGWVKAFRGPRQGDPLSPFLFTIVVDVLSRLIVREKEKGVFEGFLVGRDRTRVSYLQFANDTIFFSRASFEELQSLKLILVVFGRLSRLRINLNKSTLSGINISQSQTVRLASILDCAISD
ncbi:LINE-1 retrotransposable element ORF2 protein [Vitis vinifera]|uniref:LINE-1 retrotransposable element ORF2 protein n=1 Tax=Vitis vinifera TaxID=29760 RepID=A0A438FUV6_VITVI|nr:LINE-1 retrotransposable element ORF2 protein [Vitis vinifera]